LIYLKSAALFLRKFSSLEADVRVLYVTSEVFPLVKTGGAETKLAKRASAQAVEAACKVFEALYGAPWKLHADSIDVLADPQ
jgi:hypothetical protein